MFSEVSILANHKLNAIIFSDVHLALQRYPYNNTAWAKMIICTAIYLEPVFSGTKKK